MRRKETSRENRELKYSDGSFSLSEILVFEKMYVLVFLTSRAQERLKMVGRCSRELKRYQGCSPPAVLKTSN